jgi:hypothetical protein
MKAINSFLNLVILSCVAAFFGYMAYICYGFVEWVKTPTHHETQAEFQAGRMQYYCIKGSHTKAEIEKCKSVYPV